MSEEEILAHLRGLRDTLDRLIIDGDGAIGYVNYGDGETSHDQGEIPS